jgi:hypothetical protein
MKLIAHRGNRFGPHPEWENNPDYLTETIRAGYDVELDVRRIDGRFYLGHDNPDYEVDMKFFAQIRESAWIHCKNLEALHFFLKMPEFNCFWHQNDDYTVTSHGFIWAFPGKPVTSNSIAVMPEYAPNFNIPASVFGVCTDYVEKYLHYK